MTRSPDGRCADCVTVGDVPDRAVPGRRYCNLHGYERERERKRRNKEVSRARQEGKPVPPERPFVPLSRAQFGAINVYADDRRSIRIAASEVDEAVGKVRAAMEGTDGYAVGLAAEDLIDATVRLRRVLDSAIGL